TARPAPSRPETPPAASPWRSAQIPWSPASTASSPNPTRQSTPPALYHNHCSRLLQRFPKHGKCGQVDADSIKPDQQRHRNQRDPDKVGGQDLHRGAEGCNALNPSADYSREAVRDPQQDCDDKYSLQHQKDGKPQGADRDGQVVERCLRRREEAQEVEREDDPADGGNGARKQDIAQQQGRCPEHYPQSCQARRDPDQAALPAEPGNSALGDREH